MVQKNNEKFKIIRISVSGLVLLLISCSGKLDNRNSDLNYLTASKDFKATLEFNLFIENSDSLGELFYIKNPTVDYESSVKDDFYCLVYRLEWNSKKVVFFDSVYNEPELVVRGISLDGTQLQVNDMYSRFFRIQDMELNIVYSESDFFGFKNSSDYLVVRSKSMNWVGAMANFYLVQLIDLRRKIVIRSVIKQI